MCSLTFIPCYRGYYLAMNRDERKARRDAVPPESTILGGTPAVYPRDSAGGTWIAANNAGIALALLNWNDVAANPAEKTRSRGSLIPQLISQCTLQELQDAMGEIGLKGVLPFRVVGLVPTKQVICEWRWDLNAVESQTYPWVRRHWFSSSLSDDQATMQRGAVCERAWGEDGSGSLSWLRRLHGSHVNGPGPFSLCVHRKDVKTLSYTELVCTADSVACRYFDGSPCEIQENLAETSIVRV
jgi:hypothetical protein